jgi:hypothetical protein
MLRMLTSDDVLRGHLLLGIAVILLNITIHALIITRLTVATRHASYRFRSTGAQIRTVLILTTSVAILMFAHCIEVTIWASTYVLTDAVKDDADALYFAFVNYTTLGYGDIVPINPWRILGPVAAMNGILLFGWSTAVIYEILRTLHEGSDEPRAR